MRLTIFLLLIAAGSLQAQQFSYQVLFEGIGDNREFTTYPIDSQQTILASRAEFEGSISIDNHHLHGGLSYLLRFGDNLGPQKPQLLMYYRYLQTNFTFIFGAFPRRDKIDFPLALLTDTIAYFKPIIQGTYSKIRWDWGHQSAFLDWTSRKTSYEREQFMAGTTGEVSYNGLFLQNYFLMDHKAFDERHLPGQYLEDYWGAIVLAGLRNHNTGASLQIQVGAGLLNTAYRLRHSTDGFVIANSFYAQATGSYGAFALKTVIKTGGQNRMPYGDPFYYNKNYLRSDLVWNFIRHKNVQGRFNFAFHVLNWEQLDTQQQLYIVYTFGR